jgi:hypothetical protein
VISAVTGWTYTEILQQHYTSSGLGHDQHECTHRNCFSVTTVLLFYPVVSFPFSPLLFFPFLSFPYFTKLALFCFYTVPTLFLHCSYTVSTPSSASGVIGVLEFCFAFSKFC